METFGHAGGGSGAQSPGGKFSSPQAASQGLLPPAAAAAAALPNFSQPGDVMIVGEPTLMGGDFGEEDERLITRLENRQAEQDSPCASVPNGRSGSYSSLLDSHTPPQELGREMGGVHPIGRFTSLLSQQPQVAKQRPAASSGIIPCSSAAGAKVPLGWPAALESNGMLTPPPPPPPPHYAGAASAPHAGVGAADSDAASLAATQTSAAAGGGGAESTKAAAQQGREQNGTAVSAAAITA